MTSEELAWKIRHHALEMTHISGGSHIAAILSIADIIGVLYNDVMNIFPNDSKNERLFNIFLISSTSSFVKFVPSSFFDFNKVQIS